MGFQHTPGLAAENGRKTKRGPNRQSRPFKQFVSSLLDENQDQIREDIKGLDPKDRIAALSKLAEFGEPKLRSVEQKYDIDSLSDEEVNRMVDKILDRSHG